MTRNELPKGETYKASIADSEGRFLIRSDKRLYCIQEKGQGG